MDIRYQRIIAECASAVGKIASGNRVLVQPIKHPNYPRPGHVEISAFWKHWPCLFPQHGAGRKHERRIILEPWQQSIVTDHPEQLIRGLIQSDGCRFINPITHTRPGGDLKRYEYPRYVFTNHSGDIQRIFTDALDRLGIRWRNSSWKNVSIARGADVAALDSFVGPKS